MRIPAHPRAVAGLRRDRAHFHRHHLFAGRPRAVRRQDAGLHAGDLGHRRQHGGVGLRAIPRPQGVPGDRSPHRAGPQRPRRTLARDAGPGGYQPAAVGGIARPHVEDLGADALPVPLSLAALGRRDAAGFRRGGVVRTAAGSAQSRAAALGHRDHGGLPAAACHRRLR